ncbi:MAG: hypothetical protein P8O07_04315 [Crocinitomicaceae bacterium]|nr:hypothetical protein [Crocinitomicaceae bacterium]
MKNLSLTLVMLVVAFCFQTYYFQLIGQSNELCLEKNPFSVPKTTNQINLASIKSLGIGSASMFSLPMVFESVCEINQSCYGIQKYVVRHVSFAGSVSNKFIHMRGVLLNNQPLHTAVMSLSVILSIYKFISWNGIFIIGIGLVIFPFVIRFIQMKKFLKNISTICYMYDWKIVDEEPEKLLEILKENYYVKAEWSAYNFLFLQGPSPYSIFFSFKVLDIYNFYEKSIVDKVKNKVVKID